MTAASTVTTAAVIRTILEDNWYRIARYESPGQAGPAIENVAAEIAKFVERCR